jgi:2-oxoglutarate dehydrogenase complex dehydrogenase (E1) component-like enzyme
MIGRVEIVADSGEDAIAAGAAVAAVAADDSGAAAPVVAVAEEARAEVEIGVREDGICHRRSTPLRIHHILTRVT